MYIFVVFVNFACGFCHVEGKIMSTPVRVLADMGPLLVTVESEPHWTPTEADEHSGDEIRCRSLDESRSGPRTICRWAEDRLDEAAYDGHHRRTMQGPRPLAFRRVASPSRLHLGSDRLRPRSSSGGRRSSDTTAPAKEKSVPDGGPVAHGQGYGQSRVLRLSRDATQPNSGSVSDLRGSQELDDEESDVLPALGTVTGVRPRAYTCPDIKAMQRRTKVRLLNRPPTPTPGDDLDPVGGLVVPETEKVRSRSNSGEVFCHNSEDDPLPVISET